MKQEQIELLFLQNADVIDIMVNSFARVSGYGDDDELRSVCHHAFMTVAIPKWDEGKAAFRTFLYRVLRNALIYHVRKYNKPNTTSVITTDGEEFSLTDLIMSPYTEWQPDMAARCADWLLTLTDDMRYIINLLLHPNKKLKLNGAQKPKHIRGAIRRHLLDYGWTHNRVWSTFNQLKLEVSML